MKILISNFGIKDKGGFGRTFPISCNLARLGHNVVLITTKKQRNLLLFQTENRNKVKIIAFNDFVPDKFLRGGYGVISLICKLLYACFHRFDIVYSDTGHRPLSGWPCILNRIIYSSKYYSEWWDLYQESNFQNGSFFKKLFNRIESKAEINNRRRANGVIVLSSFMKERAINYGIDPNKIIVVHGGSDIERILFINSDKWKEKFGFKKGSIVFGFIGMSDSDIEDIEPFINALSIINSPKVEWFTIGRTFSNNTIKQYQIGSELHQFGWIDYANSSELLSCADIYVLIKKNTNRNIAGWPNKLGDYFAIGRPIMITPYGDTVNYIKDNPDAFITVEHNTKSITSILDKLLKNREFLKDKNQKVRKLASENYSWFERAKLIDQFIQKNI